jgi:regulator of sigma E protease
MALFLAILGLGLLIMVHEAGHMFLARLMGMRVDRFSMGFGPTLLRWRGKKTTYQIAMIPLGGFVQIAGMNPHEQLSADDPGSYAHKPAHARFATILAGPLTNYLFAIVIMCSVMLLWGFPNWQNMILEVEKDSPAARAGLLPDDKIAAIDGKPVTTVGEATEEIASSGGRPLRVTLVRGASKVTLTVTPRPKKRTFRIGVAFGRKLTFSPLGAGSAIALGCLFPLDQTSKALAGFKQLFSGQAGVEQVSGPLEIVRQLKLSFEDSLAMALILLAILSVYLGLFNLMPLPALDGGRLLFLLFGMIFRRPVDQRIENAVHMVGFLLLLGLLLLVTFGDVARLFKHP